MLSPKPCLTFPAGKKNNLKFSNRLQNSEGKRTTSTMDGKHILTYNKASCPYHQTAVRFGKNLVKNDCLLPLYQKLSVREKITAL